MIDLKGNFKNGQTDLKCRKCEREEESQLHLLECEALNDDSLVVSTPSYQDLFGMEPAETGKILQHKFKLLLTPCAPMSAAAVNSIELDNK